MTKKILCRADGNSEIGLGHLYRMLAIAQFYKEYYELIFITKESSTSNIIPKEFIVRCIPDEITFDKEPQWIFSNFSPSRHILIADGYQFVSRYQKEIKKLGFTLIYIDDLAKEHMYADVVVNHSPYAKKTHYTAEKHTQFALGTSYAMLRPRFNEAAKHERPISRIDTAFVCFGGADPYDLSLKTAKALLNIKTIEYIHVVLGAAYNHIEIYFLEKKHSKLNLHKNLNEKDLYDLMNSCHIAVAPSSTILYEICSVKMPVLSGYYVDNQKFLYKGFSEKAVFLKGGDFTTYSVADFQEQLENLITSDKSDLLIKNQQKQFKGYSKINFLGLLNRLTTSFRKANKNDLILVYNWSNDALVRKNSYNSESIALEDHKKWFESKIDDGNTIFLIALINDIPAGIVRFSLEDEHAIVGILISKTFRGQKLAAEFLRKSAKLFFQSHETSILAYIKKENEASVKAFESAGYMYYKDEIVQGNVSFVYKLKKEDVKG